VSAARYAGVLAHASDTWYVAAPVGGTVE